MSIRLKCPACQTSFLAPDDAMGESATCPKCGAKLKFPRAAPAATPDEPAPSSFYPHPADDPPPRPRRLRRIALVALALLPIVAVGLLIAWPWLRERPIAAPAPPQHPAEATAQQFLAALVANDAPAIARLSTVADPPAIRSHEAPRLSGARTEALRGSFAPIAALHAKIDKDYVFDEAIGRFQPRNALGPAAETLDALNETKTGAESANIFARLADPDPDVALDSIDDLAKVLEPMIKLSESTLSPKKLIPTYAQLVEQADPPLPAVEAELALDYGANMATWDALLKRPFLTIQADGPFVLDRAEVVARVRDRLAETDAPPSLLRLSLVRFRLEGIDTGWKVTAARRDQMEPPPAVEPAPPTRSPGESPPPVRSLGDSPPGGD